MNILRYISQRDLARVLAMKEPPIAPGGGMAPPRESRGTKLWFVAKVFAHARHVEGENNKERLEILTSVLPDQELFW